jgi:hypothetical protein
MSWQSIEMYKTKEIHFIDCGVQIMKILSLRMTNTDIQILYLLCLGIGDREREQSLPVPSHYCLFIDPPLFTLSTILQYYDIFPF